MTNLVELTIPAPDAELFDRADRSLILAKGQQITCQVDLDAAGAELQVIKSLQKQLEEKRTSITGPLNESLRRVNDLFRPAKQWLEEAEAIRKQRMVAYRAEQEEKARKEQARLEAEARKERERLAAKAAEEERKAREKADAERRAAEEKEREAREARERAEAAARAETDAVRREEAERAARAAREAQEKADREAAAQRAKADQREQAAAEKAQGLRDQAAAVAAPRVVADVQRTAGQAIREVWSFRVVDEALVPREYLAVDLQKLRAVVNALKGSTSIPGVVVTRGEVIASRAS